MNSRPTPLLANGRAQHFDPDLAAAIGLEKAIVLHRLHFWIDFNRRSEKLDHYRSGRWCTYNSWNSWRNDNFRYWSMPTVRRIFASLERDGFIVSQDHENDKKGRWYSVCYEALEKLGFQVYADQSELGKSPHPDQIDHSKSAYPDQNDQSEVINLIRVHENTIESTEKTKKTEKIKDLTQPHKAQDEITNVSQQGGSAEWEATLPSVKADQIASGSQSENAERQTDDPGPSAVQDLNEKQQKVRAILCSRRSYYVAVSHLLGQVAKPDMKNTLAWAWVNFYTGKVSDTKVGQDWDTYKIPQDEEITPAAIIGFKIWWEHKWRDSRTKISLPTKKEKVNEYFVEYMNSKYFPRCVERGEDELVGLLGIDDPRKEKHIPVPDAEAQFDQIMTEIYGRPLKKRVAMELTG